MRGVIIKGEGGYKGGGNRNRGAARNKDSGQGGVSIGKGLRSGWVGVNVNDFDPVPTSMVPASWAKGTSRWDWLNGHGPAFLNACKNGSKFEWLNILYRDWFEVYHVSLPVDVEPVPGAVYPEPVGEAAIKEIEAMVTLRKKAEAFSPMFPETLALSGGLVTPLLISSTPKPRHKQIEHVYSLLYYNSQVKDAVEARHLIDNEENPLSPQETRSRDIVTQQRLTKEHWLAESLEIQAIVAEKWKSDYKQVVTEWESRNKDIQEPYKQQL
ncbi:hypothetical protein BS47DRAFT_1368837 [Hydnum rufescens UP504]|uniref:Uncharacterized protein n=1 Tax=Hydnum rufescens UP504 TaxID=1448309 RepID=A0A9P6AG90_9AGAM|nr:hypothetical protein BS47DRAFT_1368837 [Hydnum rufescens UP504]